MNSWRALLGFLQSARRPQTRRLQTQLPQKKQNGRQSWRSTSTQRLSQTHIITNKERAAAAAAAAAAFCPDFNPFCQGPFTLKACIRRSPPTLLPSPVTLLHEYNPGVHRRKLEEAQQQQEEKAREEKRAREKEAETVPRKKARGKGKAKITDEQSDEILRLREEVARQQEDIKELQKFQEKVKTQNIRYVVQLWEENAYMKQCLAVYQRVPPIPNLNWVAEGWDYYGALKGKEGEK